MGIWGAKLYEDDLALDIKDEYIEKLKQGKSDEEALKEIIEENTEVIEDEDEGPVFWLALADTMWKKGRLTEKVKKEALLGIEKNLKQWKEEASSKEYAQRKRELENFKLKIEQQEMPIRKEIKSKTENSNRKIKAEWEIGGVYAYQLKSEKAKELGLDGRYLIFRKIKDGSTYRNNIVYCQITNNKELPNTKQELENLEYIIVYNNGNVKYEYAIELCNITKKILRQEFIYIGNFADIDVPINEYQSPYILYQPYYYKEMEDKLLMKLSNFGTNLKPTEFDINPRDELDMKIRFLMRVKYYKKVLNIIPPDDAIVKDNPLLYIALVDAMMIGGIVTQNGVGPLTEEMKKEAYNRIKVLKGIINSKEDNKKEEKIKILDELEQKIKEFTYSNPFEKYINP